MRDQISYEIRFYRKIVPNDAQTHEQSTILQVSDAQWLPHCFQECYIDAAPHYFGRFKDCSISPMQCTVRKVLLCIRQPMADFGSIFSPFQFYIRCTLYNDMSKAHLFSFSYSVFI